MLPMATMAPMIWMMHAALVSFDAWLAAFAYAAGPGAVAALWQSAVIALIAGVGLRVAQRIGIHIGAAQRFGVWVAAFVAIVILPFLSVLEPRALFGDPTNAPLGALTPAQPLHLPHIQIDDRWALGLAALWIAASLVRAAVLIRHSCWTRRLWSSATPVRVDENLRGLLAATSPLRRRVEICTSRRLDRPGVIGFFAPRILIPEWLFERLTAAELEHVVLHEAEHLRRCDDWINLLQKLALVLFPLNPALVWIERRLCREREMACDEGVVGRTQAPRAYAASLANVAGHAIERRRADALSLGAFERRSELARRVSSLLTRKPAFHPMAARALVGVTACGLIAVSLELARCPQMMAFVPAAPAAVGTQSGASLAQVEGDRVYRQSAAGASGSGFHALAAKADLPSGEMSFHRSYEGVRAVGKAPTEMSAADGSRPTHGVGTPATTLLQNNIRQNSSAGGSFPAGESSRQDLVAQEASTAERQSSSAVEAQFVVFTAWERIETRRAVPIADYDTNATQIKSTQSNASAENPQLQQHSVEITVTRLIFWVSPRPANANDAASASKTPRPSASDLHLLSVPTPASGWLVLEL